MGLSTDLSKQVDQILKTNWQTRAGTVVPEPEQVQLGNDAVTLSGTVLYADLAQSTALVKGFKNWFAAEVYKAYLVCACRIIRENGGIITAFDGDRVMAVYIGDTKNTSAAKTALQINYVVTQILNPKIKAAYPDTSYQVQQTVGIDTSPLFVAKTGIRGSNDLVWVGRAANYAAKLCALREGAFASYITADAHSPMTDDTKFGGNPRQSMWEQRNWTEQGITVYRSSWHWNPG